jgi:hypothetical protein
MAYDPHGDVNLSTRIYYHCNTCTFGLVGSFQIRALGQDFDKKYSLHLTPLGNSRKMKILILQRNLICFI